MAEQEYQRQTREHRHHASEPAFLGGVTLRGSVGLRGRVNNVANLIADKEKVYGLLSEIPMNEGGRKGAWQLPPPPVGPPGQCPKVLADAIWQFQQFWKDAGIFKYPDGVVDPGGNTLRHMNNLVFGKGRGRMLPIDPKPRPFVELDDWYVTNLSLSGAGLVAPVGGGAYWGGIDFEHFSNEGHQAVHGKIAIAGVGAGASVGLPWLKNNTLLQKALKFVADNGGLSHQDLPSATIGLCFPNKDQGLNHLSSTDFFGPCVTHFISGNIFVGSAGAWALYFGLPRNRDWLAYLVQSMLTLGTSIVGQHAKGLALISSAGFGVSASLGAAYNAYGGEIA